MYAKRYIKPFQMTKNQRTRGDAIWKFKKSYLDVSAIIHEEGAGYWGFFTAKVQEIIWYFF
jgi:hypothetical protein